MPIFALSLFVFVQPLLSFATEIPAELKGIEIVEKLGQSVDHDIALVDETGASVTLGKYLAAGRPVVVSMVYFGCPNLCTFVLNGLREAVQKSDWTPGEQYEVVSVSIDPAEDSELAAQKKAAYLEGLGKPGAEKGWHFLTAPRAKKGSQKGDDASIKKLASQLGFGYRWVESEKQFAHGAALFVLTPAGKISRILYGIQYAKQDFRLALLEASNGKIGTIVDRFLLFCYRYDPKTRKYSIVLTQIMRGAAAVTVLAMGVYFGGFWLRQRRGRSRKKGA